MRNISGDLANSGGNIGVHPRKLTEALEEVREPHHQCVVTGNEYEEICDFVEFVGQKIQLPTSRLPNPQA